jgi:hypothetical protein
MDHKSAIANHTAERYLLGELNNVERDAYEEHFFSCMVCAEEVKLASEFIETAKKVVREELDAPMEKEPLRRTGKARSFSWESLFQPLLRPIPAMACALLTVALAVVIYQNRIANSRLSQMAANSPTPAGAQLLAPTPFLIGEARDGITIVTVSRKRAVPLQFDILDSKYDSYRAEVLTQSNVSMVSLDIPRKEATNPVLLVIRAGVLSTGKYMLVIRGVNSHGSQNVVEGDVAHIPFQVNVQD